MDEQVFTPGTVVKLYGDNNVLYQIIEDNDNRVLVMALIDMTIQPTQTVSKSWIERIVTNG